MRSPCEDARILLLPRDELARADKMAFEVAASEPMAYSELERVQLGIAPAAGAEAAVASSDVPRSCIPREGSRARYMQEDQLPPPPSPDGGSARSSPVFSLASTWRNRLLCRLFVVATAAGAALSY